MKYSIIWLDWNIVMKQAVWVPVLVQYRYIIMQANLHNTIQQYDLRLTDFSYSPIHLFKYECVLVML